MVTWVCLRPEFRRVMTEVSSYPSYKERSLPDCLLLVTQRLTKYPVLVDSILKATTEEAAGAQEVGHLLFPLLLGSEGGAGQVEGMREGRGVVRAFAGRVDAGVDGVQLRRQWARLAAAADSHSRTKLLAAPFTVPPIPLLLSEC